MARRIKVSFPTSFGRVSFLVDPKKYRLKEIALELKKFGKELQKM